MHIWKSASVNTVTCCDHTKSYSLSTFPLYVIILKSTPTPNTIKVVTFANLIIRDKWLSNLHSKLLFYSGNWVKTWNWKHIKFWYQLLQLLFFSNTGTQLIIGLKWLPTTQHHINKFTDVFSSIIGNKEGEYGHLITPYTHLQLI